MVKSESLQELFAALAKAQGEMKSVPMDAKNPHFNSRYATLSATQEVVRGPLSRNGLALIQSVEVEGDEYFVESMLTHSSGQWLHSRIKLILFKKDMQGLGSATTYAKRYAAQAILGLSGDEDDDGNAASIPPIKKDRMEVPKPQPKQNQNHAPASEEFIGSIYGLCIDRDVKESELNFLITKGYGIDGNQLPQWIAKEIYDLMSLESTNSATIMAQAQRVISRREAARLMGEKK